MPDWTERRLAHESRHSLQAASASHSHILLRLPKFFSSPGYLQQHILSPHKHQPVLCGVSANHTRFFFIAHNAAKECDWVALLNKSDAVHCIGAHVQVWCWQDISAGQCICSHPSSETLSTPTLHYHNALGSVKRPAVIWKGNYLLWNLHRHTKK